MADGRVFYNDVSGAFTITATSTATDYFLTDISNDRPRNFWRSAAAGTQYINFNGGTTKAVKGCFIVNTNFTASDTTLQLQASDNDFVAITETQDFEFMPTTLYEIDEDTREINTVTYMIAYALLDVSRQDYRVKFVTGTGLTNYEAGRVFLFSGDYTFDKNFQKNFVGGLETDSVYHSVKGMVTKEHRFQRFIASFDFVMNVNSQAEILTKVLPINPSLLFFPEGVAETPVYFGVFDSTAPENFNSISGDKKTYHMDFREII